MVGSLGAGKDGAVRAQERRAAKGDGEAAHNDGPSTGAPAAASVEAIDRYVTHGDLSPGMTGPSPPGFEPPQCEARPGRAGSTREVSWQRSCCNACLALPARPET